MVIKDTYVNMMVVTGLCNTIDIRKEMSEWTCLLHGLGPSPPYLYVLKVG